MDAVRSLALDLFPVVGVLAVLLGTWICAAALAARADRPAPRPHGGSSIPRPRAGSRDRELTRD